MVACDLSKADFKKAGGLPFPIIETEIRGVTDLMSYGELIYYLTPAKLGKIEVKGDKDSPFELVEEVYTEIDKVKFD